MHANHVSTACDLWCLHFLKLHGLMDVDVRACRGFPEPSRKLCIKCACQIVKAKLNVSLDLKMKNQFLWGQMVCLFFLDMKHHQKQQSSSTSQALFFTLPGKKNEVETNAAIPPRGACWWFAHGNGKRTPDRDKAKVTALVAATWVD